MERGRTARRRWADLSDGQRRGIVVLGAATTLWQMAMLRDLWRRSDDEIRGHRWAWVLASFVRPVGQVAYYLWGRRG